MKPPGATKRMAPISIKIFGVTKAIKKSAEVRREGGLR
jgi:hypothetical protein